MAIFSRRRLQAMVDALGPFLASDKAGDVLARLEHKDTQSALAAEFEVGLLWSLSRVGHLKVEPVFPKRRSQIDAMSDDLFSSGPVAIEITALSDDTFSGKADMDRAANIIVQFAKGVRKEADKHLYFQFAERSYYDKGHFHRVRCIDRDFSLAVERKEKLSTWLKSAEWQASQTIRLTGDEIDVVISWRQSVHPLFRTHCSMPAVAYHAEDNPLYKALKKKERQLSGAPVEFMKCVFIGDAGCSILRQLKLLNSAGREMGGERIIRHFLAKSRIDAVCVFSPSRTPGFFGSLHSNLFWQVTIFPRQNGFESQYESLRKLAARLPRPNLEGYQARTRHLQGSLRPQERGQYLGSYMTSNGFSSTIKISARLVLEMLSGRLTPDQFRQSAFGKSANLLDSHLSRGMTIQDVRIEKSDLDEDDDHFVFHLDFDAAASPLTSPKTSRAKG